MSDPNKYKSLIEEIIAKQSIILGPDIAVMKAKNIPGLKVNREGKVINISGNAKQIIQLLIDSYVELSGQIVKSAMASVFSKYPDLNHNNNHNN